MDCCSCSDVKKLRNQGVASHLTRFCNTGASWGVFFSAYNRARARYQRRTGSAQLSPAVNLAAAAEAGALVSQQHTAAAAASGRALLRCLAAGTVMLLAMACTAGCHGSSLRAGHSSVAVSAEQAQFLAASIIML